MLKTMLQCCAAAKLQKCFVVYENSPDYSLAWGCVDKGRIFIIG